MAPESKPGSSRPASSAAFPIVGIGASAGGLAAFEAFFGSMPADREPGMAFVLVQHLAPDHQSILAELIGRYSHLSVFEATDGLAVQVNCAFTIPPGHDLSFAGGILHLSAPSPSHGLKLPIDSFFRSLAADQGERSICVILSGTGSDGSEGLKAVKAAGGLVIVQNPDSSEYDGMPRSAIQTGLVDFVLPAAEMLGQLIHYREHDFGKIQVEAPRPSEAALEKIHDLLKYRTGHDFSQYKQSTIKRRIERQMAIHKLADMGAYAQALQDDPAEVDVLFKDLLIGVTHFFRDSEAFGVLESQTIPQLFQEKPSAEAIRVWVCACSTGEEAYSVAILLHEQNLASKTQHKLQIFATDIDHGAIEQACSGRFPLSIAQEITEERLNSFFTLEADGSMYRINKVIRDMLIFSEHDCLKDPPFSRLDLITCRNLLIYLGSKLQKALIPLFHYALNPGGMLFLGSSESIGDFEQLFVTVDRTAKLYRRQEDHSPARLPGLGRFHPAPVAPGGGAAAPAVRQASSARETTERLLAERFAPVSVLVNEKGDMLYVHGNTGRYLEMSSGEPGLNILKLAREGLRRDVTLALHGASKTRAVVERPGLRLDINGASLRLNLTVLPVKATGDSAPDATLFLVIFDEKAALAAAADPPRSETMALAENATLTPEQASLIEELQKELRSKEEFLKSTNEELETTNEDLKSSNEEMQSINEELQSTNEELETSKEELQSVNEELTTVNTELHTKVVDLSRANNDMNNLLAGTGVGTIFVDFKLRIQRFTPSVTQVINLILSDVGRPVGHIVSNLRGYDSLVEDIKRVLDDLIPQEIEVETISGNWFLLRIRPYRTLENVIEGAVITFFDISEIKRTRESLKKANELLRLAVVVRDAHDAVILQDLEGKIMAWNPSAARMYGWSEAEALAKNIRELIPEALREAELEKVHQIGGNRRFEPYRSQRITSSGEVVEIWLTATALMNEAGQVYAISTTERAG